VVLQRGVGHSHAVAMAVAAAAAAARQPAVNKHRPTTERRAPAGDMLMRYINVRALTARCRRAGAKSAIVYSTDV